MHKLTLRISQEYLGSASGVRVCHLLRSESISFMVHASHAGAEFPTDVGKQAPFHSDR